jgi:multidrug efflux pump subunit AcrA (membrane-fusion protein)
MVLSKIVLAAAAATVVLSIACQGAAATQSNARPPAPVRVTKVTKGSIASNLSYSGEIQALDAVDIMATSTGRIQDMYVDEGAEVSAGSPLARQETDALGASVRQAEAKLQGDRAKLDQILLGARPEDVAAAQSLLEGARARLIALRGENGGSSSESGARAGLENASASRAKAEAKLAQLLNPTQEDIAAAEAAIAAAQDSVESAQSQLDILRAPTPSSVSAAQAAVDSAQAALDDLKLMPKPQDVALAQANLSSAQATQKGAQSTLASLQNLLTTDKLKDMLAAYRGLVAARAKLQEDIGRNAGADTIAADQDGINLALNKLQIAEDNAQSFKIGVTGEQALAAQAAVDSADALVARFRAELDQVMAGPTAARTQAAASALETARATLDKLKNPTSADIAIAEARVTNANSTLVAAQNKLRTLKNPTNADIQSAQADVAAAKAAEETARVAVGTAIGNTDAQVATVAQNEQGVIQAQSKGFTQSDVALAAAAVAQDEGAAEAARILVERATLVAPFDAIVAKRNVGKGATVTSATVIFSLVSKATQLSFNVEEAAVAQLATGQSVSFTIAATNKPFKGRVTSIAPTADVSSRTFRVRVAPDPGQEGLRAGMFANLTIAVQSLDGALLVPQEAIVQKGQESVVYVLRDDTVEQRTVAVGLRNDRFVQLRSGAQEGEEVVIQGNRSLKDGDKVNVARDTQGAQGQGRQQQGQ